MIPELWESFLVVIFNLILKYIYVEKWFNKKLKESTVSGG